MRRNLVRNTLFLALAALLIAGSLIAMHVVARADQNAQATLSGQNVPLVQRARLVRAADANQALHLSIGLRPNDASGLDGLLRAIYTPGSPQYHHYLTPSDFTQLFAPTTAQVQQVIAFLHSQGINALSIAPNRLLIDATATVALAQQAFHVNINIYRYTNHTFYANAQAPSVPVALQSLVASIGGLDDSAQYQPLFQDARNSPRQALAPSGYGPAELSQAYDTAPFTSSSMQGENQSVAIFELDGYQLSDVQQYFQQYSLNTPAISNVLVDGASGAAGAGAIEVELDMEVVGAIAPHAQQLIYEGPNSTQGLNDTYNRIVTDNRAQVISTSWGLCESSTGQAELLILDTIFQQAAAQGITIYAAAGDSGAYDCNDASLAVDSPADDPYVTGVGGTNLQLGANDSYGSESVWANASDTQRSPEGAGGGGGISNTFVQPAWQNGPGVISSDSSGQPCGASNGQYCREVPDISADADPATGYAVYCTVSAAGCSASGWITVGGTSAAAPLWAGSTALINQYLQSWNLPPLGSANPALYSLFNSQQAVPAFHDITNGNNLYYPATSGYDMASGLGSPDVNNLAEDLTASAHGGGTPTPAPMPSPGETPTLTPTSTPSPSPTTSPQQELLKNPGFETGQKPWQESSSGAYELISSLNPHSGSYSAYLCGYTACDDRIWQTVSVPTTYHSLDLSYWWYSDSAKTTSQCLDSFTVLLQTAAGKSIQTLQHDCNNQPTNGWTRQNIDLSTLLAPYKGQRVELLFHGITQANQYQTSDFFVDDVYLIEM